MVDGPRKRQSPLLGGSSQRALRDCSPRQMARNARRGAHRPVTVTLTGPTNRWNRPSDPSFEMGGTAAGATAPTHEPRSNPVREFGSPGREARAFEPVPRPGADL